MFMVKEGFNGLSLFLICFCQLPHIKIIKKQKCHLFPV